MPAITPLYWPKLRLLAAVLVPLICVGCDQATKSLAKRTLCDASPRQYLHGIVRIEYARNPGCCFRVGGNLPSSLRSVLFIGLNGALMAAVGLFLVFKRNLSFPAYLAVLVLLAGGLGNWIDRVANQGLVTDFLNLGLGSVRTGIFNVADVAITVGAVAALLLVRSQAREGSLPTPR